MRKTVTVLFCDLAGSTALGERLDPEPLRLLLARWYEAMREPVERHGGTVEKFIGDAVMAVFGVPQVHEDDALRAVRAAVEMRDATAALDDDLGVRFGVNTGEVVTGDDVATLVTGDAVNTAKRLEEAAADGEILIGDGTRLLVENAVELEAAEPVQAKGKRRAVPAWRVLATIPEAPAFPRRIDARLVGRRRELAILRDELARTESERACRLVTVLAAAGVGKSRLASELVAEARPRATVLSARCPPYGEGITFLPLTELVRAAGGDEAVAAAVAGEPDGGLVLERLRAVIGGNEAVSGEEAFWAVRRVLESLARGRPIVVCLEDVHWAAPMFLDVLEYVAGWSRDAPILLLCLARPELLDERPHWGGTLLELDALSDEEAAELVDELAVEWPLPPEERRRAVETAEGNPLFLEQLVAMLAGGGPTDRLPPTIQALLAARLDRLAPADRAVLERAAVVGREFWRGAVLELSPDEERAETGATLLRLVHEQLVAPLPSPIAGDDGFRFRHALIRDAAYAGLSKAARADLHERFAGWLERHGAEDELVGYHLEQAHLCRAALRTPDRALAERGGEMLGRAGLRAAARGDAAATSILLRRSLALLPPGHRSRAELLRELSASLWIAGDVDAAELALAEAIDTAHAAGDTRLEWYGRLERAARNATAQGDTSTLVRVAEKAIAVFRELHDDLGLARAWRRLGLVAHTDQRFAAAADAFERSLAHARASGDAQEHARSADALCTALLFGPTPVETAVRRATEILESARGNVVLEAHVSTSLAGLVAMQGDFDRARLLYGTAGETYDQLGLRLPRVGWTMIVALVERLAGDDAAALEALAEGYTVLEAGGYDSHRADFAAQLAFLLAGEGRTQQAHGYVDACRGASGTPDRSTSAHLHAAEALLAGDPAEGAALARRAVALAGETDDLNLQAEMHLALARVADDPEQVAEARRLYEAKGNVAAARLALAVY